MNSSPKTAPTGYRRSQVHLHWLAFALAAFLFVTGGGMAHAWHAMLRHGGAMPHSLVVPIHIAVGLTLFAVVIARIRLRLRYGAPPPPAGESEPLRKLATVVHYLLIGVLLLAPILGLLAFFVAPEFGRLHEFLVRPILLALVGLHVAGALYHRFVLNDDVLARMQRPVEG